MGQKTINPLRTLNAEFEMVLTENINTQLDAPIYGYSISKPDKDVNIATTEVPERFYDLSHKLE